MQYGSIENLQIWRKSMDIIPPVYILIKQLPPEEKYSLCDQMRRAAISIPSNIAEGHGRASDKDFVRFLSITKGSLNELRTQVYICKTLYATVTNDADKIICQLIELDKMINALMKSLISHQQKT